MNNRRQAFADTYQRHSTAVAIIVILILTAAAVYFRFLQDDAFISFRYAENLIHGNGLVWNPGEHIEGYSNFLWTILLSCGIACGVNPIVTSQILGVLFFVLSLWYVFLLSRRIFPSQGLALLAVIIIGTNYTFLCFATGGLETQMQTSLLVMFAYGVVKYIERDTQDTQRLLGLGLLCSAALLTRLDSIVIAMFFCMLLCHHLSNRKNSLKIRLANIALFLFPLIVILTSWCFWKFFYYGSVLPNSFYLKVKGIASSSQGIKYLYLFYTSYLLFPFILLLPSSIVLFFKKSEYVLLSITGVLLLWSLYIIIIGGDFIEFRFMVPLLPFLAIVIVRQLFYVLRTSVLRAVLLAGIFLGTVYHANFFEYSGTYGIESIHQLSGHLVEPKEDWIALGKFLGTTFGDSSGIILATTAAGALPFYSHLFTIDMLGVNDHWVADSGFVFSSRAGHQKIATLHYLLSRDVNLVISQPLIITPGESVSQFPMPPGSAELHFSSCTILEMPIDSSRNLLALYLRPNPSIDRVILEHHWNVHHLYASSSFNR